MNNSIDLILSATRALLEARCDARVATPEIDAQIVALLALLDARGRELVAARAAVASLEVIS